MTSAFDQLHHAMLALETGWLSAFDRSGMRSTLADVRHHVCAALPMIQSCGFDDEELEDGVFDELDAGDCVLAHEAYLSVVALGQLLRRAREESLASPGAIGLTECASWSMLGELEPFVSRADRGLARVLLADEAVEDVAASILRDGG